MPQQTALRARIQGMSHGSLALYLFLITAADGDGLSYWSKGSICRALGMESEVFAKAAEELQKADLAAYDPPLWQVLDLKGGQR